jgi:4'-phosphopantetheinyl transferase
MINILYTTITEVENNKFNFISLISENRKQKIDNYAFPKDKYLSLGAELLLLEGFWRLTNKKINLNSIKFNQYGKPYIDGSNLKFSISHSNILVSVAFYQYELGFDIEYMKEKLPQNIVDTIFSDLEKELVMYDYKLFYLVWTAKESYIKWLGKGLMYPLQMVNIIFKDDSYYIKDKEKFNTILITGDFPFPLYKYSISTSKKNNDTDVMFEFIDHTVFENLYLKYQ